ncbi:zf-HC2 domain-containing protein [Paenibacillus koleovorans]|uniref:zf-HC2 domain-containing protein n=1 Tax=Paenibacillus koleovorans TaxID=121608 RepID=UPI000FD7061D|nr:zf-HC2 domain-containing protein [Paenibacillus koleovorans]
MICKEAIPLIHEYLDGDLKAAQTAELKAHLSSCTDCHTRFQQLEKADHVFRSLGAVAGPPHMTDRILRALPPPPRRKSWVSWVRRHPALSAAAIFAIVMLSSFFSLWDQDTDLIVRGSDLDHVVIQGNQVTVPNGQTVKGNLVVENGTIQVDGTIEGNLVVIDGSYALASTAHISGEIKTVDQAVQWLWYKTNQIFNAVTH